MSASKIITLNDGHQMPNFGLGTWLSKPGLVKAAIKEAFKVGYRHLDLAYIYRNHKEIGEALEESFNEGLVKREDIFITSKLWNSFQREEHYYAHVQQMLIDLRIKNLDLLLIHWPMAFKPGKEWIGEGDALADVADHVDSIELWRRMEKLRKDGLTKSIGVCNHNQQQLEKIIKNAEIKPAVHQFEIHAYLPNIDLVNYTLSQGIAVTAYSSLGNPSMSDMNLLADPVVNEIATRIGRTPGQVLLNYIMCRGLIAIPKTVTLPRLAENFQAQNFRLSDDDIAKLNSLNKNARVCTMDVFNAHPDHPFPK